MREMHRRACWALLLAVVSGPTMASPARAATFVYVGNAESHEIYVLELDRQRGEPKVAAGFAIDPTTRRLKHVASGPLADSMAYISTDRTGRYLLAVGQLSHDLSSYAIDPASGKLTQLKEYPVGRNPNWVEIVDLP